MSTMNETVAEFLRYHNVTIPDFLTDDSQGLFLVIRAKQAIDEELSIQSQNLPEAAEPTWAITLSMLDRVYEQLEGGFIVLFTGAWASIEVVCRAAIEAAVVVLYVLQADTPKRVSQYFTHYFDETAKAIDRFELATDVSGGGRSDTANEARKMLESRRQHIEAVFRYENIPVGVIGWPKQIADRFKLVGREYEYREIYATLSSQTHNDADALVDYVITKTLEKHIENAVDLAAAELLFWHRHFIYRASELYAECAVSYAKRYGFVKAAANIAEIKQSLRARLERINQEFNAFKHA